MREYATCIDRLQSLTNDLHREFKTHFARTGVFQPVLAKHSKKFLVDFGALSIGVDETQRVLSVSLRDRN